jgi:hypothetical protein
VAAALFMSGATVKAHVSRLFTKLDGANRVQIQSSCTTVARLDALATCGTKGRASIVKARAAGRTLVDAPMRAAVRIRHGQPRPPEARSTKEDTRKQLPRPAPLIGLIELGQQLSRRGGWRDHGHRCRRARPLGGAASGLRIAWHFRASMVIMVRAATNPEESAKS